MTHLLIATNIYCINVRGAMLRALHALPHVMLASISEVRIISSLFHKLERATRARISKGWG